MALIVILYALNRFFLIPVTTGGVHDLLAWHGADALAGAMMLCILNILLALTGRPSVSRFWIVILFLLSCGTFWEVVTPMYLSRSVGDPWDVAACWLGGTAMFFIDIKRLSA